MSVRPSRLKMIKLRISEMRGNLRIALRTWSGKIGFSLLIIQLILAIYAVAVYYPEGMRGYMQSSEWYYQYPDLVPPCWSVDGKSTDIYLTEDSLNVTHEKQRSSISIGLSGFKLGVIKEITSYIGTFNYSSDSFPHDMDMLLIVHANVITPEGGTGDYKPVLPPKIFLNVSLIRPDGLEVFFYSGGLPSNQTNVTLIGAVTDEGVRHPSPVSNLQAETPNPYDIEGSIIDKSLQPVVEALGEKKATPLGRSRLILASMESGEVPKPLKGEYKLVITFMFITDEITYNFGYRGNVSVIALQLNSEANCHGYLGTDEKARPVGLGLLLGLPYAFLLGFIVTFTSTFIGAIYGTLAGYWKDIRGEAMMRVADIVLSLPFLPILIALSYVFKGSINLSLLSVLMIALFWAGPVIVVRSMALQISEQPYVEAAKAVGAGTWRIVFRHVFPQIFPYTMAIAVLSIPGIIIAEASLSLLGLGDPAAPTWGKLLQAAYNLNAVTNGFWWLYIFPGLALVIFSATFLLIGRAIEPLVAPKLQK